MKKDFRNPPGSTDILSASDAGWKPVLPGDVDKISTLPKEHVKLFQIRSIFQFVVAFFRNYIQKNIFSLDKRVL